MIWVVSKSLVASKEELDSRHQIIQEITQAKVTPWTKQCCIGARWPYRLIEFYQCTSQKGEYGLVITAHMNIDVGAFGFPTTLSERELFQQRRLGLVKAIRAVYDKVV